MKSQIRLKTFILALTITLFPAFAIAANACICGPSEPCESDAAASVVFAGVVIKTAIESPKNPAPSEAISTTYTSKTQVASFKIEEAFRGIETPEINISGGGTNCDYYFKVGERYLVYASQGSDGKTFYTSICSGTAPISEAKTSLSYIRHAAKLPAGAMISGEVLREVSQRNKAEPATAPLPNARIILENGAQRLQAISNAAGKYKLSVVPPGNYKVYTDPPTNFSGADFLARKPRNSWELTVPAHGCLDANFFARPEGEISGQVIDDSGVVPQDVWIELISINNRRVKQGYWSAGLEDFRSFKFTFLPPGKYLLGFNMESGASLTEPYPEFYYPGVAERAKATVITIGENQKVSDLYVKRPMRLAERMIKGVAVYPNGKVAAGVWVKLENPRTGYGEGNGMETDAQGHFSLKAVEGQTYNLSASIKKGTPLVDSKPLKVKVGVVNEEVRLVIEMP